MSEKASQLQFDTYEYIGVIAPGAVLSLGLIILWPETKEIFFNNDFTVGELGLFVIIAYVVGHLLQSVGNVIEKILWKCFGGMPTDWVLKENQSLISSQQKTKLQNVLKHNHNILDLGSLSNKQWYPLVREMYVDIHQKGRSNRIDSFNCTYGLLRGIASAFIALSIAIIAHSPDQWEVAAWVFGLGFVPAIFRMFRFGKIYGRELIIEYLRLKSSNKG